MNRRIWPGAAVVAAMLAVPAAAPAAGFKYGVTSAEVSSSSALVWTRANKAGRVTLEVSRNRRFRKGVKRRKVRAKAADDRTVRVKLRRLRSGTRYYYRFRQGKKRRSAVGRFVTAPRAKTRKTFTFSYSGDSDAQSERGEKVPFYNNFQVYRSMANEGNAFNINLGDTIYSDSEVGARFVNGEFEPAFVARTAQQKWAKYKQNLALANLRRVRSRTSMFNHWDDHEFINDFSRPENPAVFSPGVRAFQDYMPVTRKASTGIYRKVRWGANAELFFLDERSFRSAKVSSTSVCDNPDTGNPDFAPTVPQRIRNVFSAAYAPLARPVSEECKAALRSPSKTFLGARQLQRFTRDIKRSKARWKIVINETPMQMMYVLPYDRWEGYEFERQRVLRTLQSVKNTVVLTTDVHATLYNDIRFRTLEDEGPLNSGVSELTTGPVATQTYEKEVDDAVDREGTGDLARLAFFKPPPPNGLGMRCAVTDTYSYTQVKVTRRTLTLRPKDLNGRQLREEGQNANEQGPACGPYVLRAR